MRNLVLVAVCCVFAGSVAGEELTYASFRPETDVASVEIHLHLATDATRIVITEGFNDRTLAEAPISAPVVKQVALSSLGGVPSSISATWSQGRTTGFHVQLSRALADSTFQVHLFDPSLLSRDRCGDVDFPSITAAFEVFHACKYTYSQWNIYSPKWKNAVNNWFRANYFLLTQARPSPYRLDPELKRRLETVLELVNKGQYDAEQFLPIRIADIKQAIMIESNQAAFFPAAVERLARTRPATAFELNRYVLDNFENLLTQGAAPIFSGINESFLLRNDDYLRALLPEGAVPVEWTADGRPAPRVDG